MSHSFPKPFIILFFNFVGAQARWRVRSFAARWINSLFRYFLLLSGISKSRSIKIKRSMKKYPRGLILRFFRQMGSPNSSLEPPRDPRGGIPPRLGAPPLPHSPRAPSPQLRFAPRRCAPHTRTGCSHAAGRRTFCLKHQISVEGGWADGLKIKP